MIAKGGWHAGLAGHVPSGGERPVTGDRVRARAGGMNEWGGLLGDRPALPIAHHAA